MPCMGPEVNNAQVKQATRDIIDLLHNKYNLTSLKQGKSLDEKLYGQRMGTRASIVTCEHILEKVIYELFSIDSCDNF